jgi:hypothetical protein
VLGFDHHCVWIGVRTHAPFANDTHDHHRHGVSLVRALETSTAPHPSNGIAVAANSNTAHPL